MFAFFAATWSNRVAAVKKLGSVPLFPLLVGLVAGSVDGGHLLVGDYLQHRSGRSDVQNLLQLVAVTLVLSLFEIAVACWIACQKCAC